MRKGEEKRLAILSLSCLRIALLIQLIPDLIAAAWDIRLDETLNIVNAMKVLCGYLHQDT